MKDDDYVASRYIVWQTNVPETVLDVYFNHVLVLPNWKRSFPTYIHPAIRDVVELASNRTKIVTTTSEYVFAFEERTTFVPEAAEFVRTGTLELHYNNTLVLRLNISPPDDDEVGRPWVARGIEEFKDGEWVAELTQLDPKLAAYEIEQKQKDEVLRQNELEGVTELREKLSNLSLGKAEKPSWFWRLLQRSVNRSPARTQRTEKQQTRFLR